MYIDSTYMVFAKENKIPLHWKFGDTRMISSSNSVFPIILNKFKKNETPVTFNGIWNPTEKIFKNEINDSILKIYNQYSLRFPKGWGFYYLTFEGYPLGNGRIFPSRVLEKRKIETDIWESSGQWP